MDLAKLQYFPLALPHFSVLVVIFLFLVVWIEAQALRSAYLSLGLGPHTALLLLLASLAGSYLNIPVALLPPQQIVSHQEVWFFGMHYVIPEVISQPGTVIAVNVGGALTPGLLSLYLYIRNQLWITGTLGTVVVARRFVIGWPPWCLASALPFRFSCHRLRLRLLPWCCRGGMPGRSLTSAARSAR
jgi:uncharacterized membrane protein